MQLTRNILKNAKQYIPKVFIQGSTVKLYEEFCYTSQNQKEAGRKNHMIF